jgi:endonuclease VIII
VPEGHTIRRLADRHRALFAGRRVTVQSPQGRFAEGAASLSGRVLRDTDAYGKHLFHRYGGGRTLHVHLGLYGRFSDGTGRPPDPVGEVRLRMYTRAHWLDLRGPAACEVLTPPEVDALLARLGPDPLREDCDHSGSAASDAAQRPGTVARPGRAYARIRRSDKPLLALLLDQSIVAGAGLIYATEVLFRAGLPPTTPGRELEPEAWQGIWADLVALMREGVARGRIDTVHTAHTPEAMGRAPRVDRHGGEVYVYRRAGYPCLVCGAPVRSGTLAGRNTYWCTTCQPAPVPTVSAP